MAFLEKQLFVKKSTIPNSGKGLFTKKLIPKGERVIEYKGRICKWSEVKNDDHNGYIYSINRNHVIDALKTLKALARYANDAKGITRVKGLTNNCDYVNDGKHAYIESTKEIPAGGEIFVSYGKEYWDVMKENKKIDAKAEKAGKGAKGGKTAKKTLKKLKV